MMGLLSWLVAAACGAGFMYWLDLRQGRRGRVPFWSRVNAQAKKANEALNSQVRHLRHKA